MPDPRLTQYDYKANSNLVLQADSSLIDKRPSNDATGEVQSLVGRISGRMGDKTGISKPNLSKHSDSKSRKPKPVRNSSKLKNDLKRLKGQSIVDIDAKDLIYKPRSDATTKVYQLILKFVTNCLDLTALPHAPTATDEVLKIMKDVEKSEAEKRNEIHDILFTNPLSASLDDGKFNNLSNLCKKINDYPDSKDKFKNEPEDIEDGKNAYACDEDGDDSDEYDMEERADESSDSDGQDLVFETEQTLHFKDSVAIDNDDDPLRKSKKEPFVLDPNEIDAHWLQRNLRSRRIFEDSDSDSLQKKEDIAAALENSRDDKEVEVRLIKLIGKNHFDFIKLLKQNRKMIVYCTKLAKSTGGERDEVKNQMKKDKDLSQILNMLDNNQTVMKTSNEITSFAPMDITENTLESQCKTINLDYLANRQAKINPTMQINEPVKKPGYQEYTIPPKKRSYQDDHLKPISELPKKAQSAFSGFKTLNLIQSKIYEKAMYSEENLLICAPTGAGKTNVALLCMLREILRFESKEEFKIIYIAPIKALAQEMVESFRSKLSVAPYNLVVDELTGDHQLDQYQISNSNVIICTPEKWDIVTRKGTDREYTKLVRLVIFDEIHLLHNERGAVLEALIARIKRHKQIEGEPIRIVGLSATLPNYRDVSRFIDSPKSGTFFFDSSYRPIPMKQQYISLTEKNKLKSVRLMNDIVYEKVLERIARQQVLIFVHTRNDTMNTAIFLKDRAFQEDKLGVFIPSGQALQEKLDEWNSECPFESRWKLKELLQFGFGIHHAGMSKTDRSRVEELFRERHIKILVSTATLAWGVNLPAHTVIVKGTQVYRPDKGRFMDLDSLDITQMLGRAGRPQYDHEGEGIVLTDQASVFFYMSLMNEQLPVESQLIARLPEFINAECVLGNIGSTQDAIRWLSETFLATRMHSVLDQKNKDHMSLYGIEPEAEFTDPDLTKHMLNFVYSAGCILDDHGLIAFDRRTGLMQSTELGRIASHYNCSSNTIKTFYDLLQPNSCDLELFRIFSLADEFKHVVLRNDETIDLQVLMNEVPYPIDDKYANPSANKVNALLQVYVYRRNIEGSAIVSDMHFIKDNAARLARAMYDIVLFKKYAKLAELALLLCKKIDKRMSLCHSPMRQFAGELDDHIIQRLENKNFTISHLRSLDSATLSELLRESHRVGTKLYRLIRLLPDMEVDAKIRPITQFSLQVELRIKPTFKWDDKYHGMSEGFWVLLHDVNGETLLHSELVHIRKFRDEKNPVKETSFIIPYMNPPHPFYFIRILSDKWFGLDKTFELSLSQIRLPIESNVITQPVDMELQTVNSLSNPQFEKIYENRYRGNTFNEIQTHTFESYYKTDDDVILLASSGCGKKTCAELSIIRNWNQYGKKSKVAIVCCNKPGAQSIYETFVNDFKMLNSILLSGNYRIDASKTIHSDNNLIIGDVESWNILALPKRAKKYRNILHRFQLFVINDIHFMRNDSLSNLEWFCAKLRISCIERSQNTKENNPCRIVAFGSPVICAENLKTWILQKKFDREPVVYNFPPAIRPVKINLTIQRFYQNNYKARITSMQRPLYRNIINHSKDKPVIVFVSNYNQAQDVAERLYIYSKNDEKSFTKHPPNSNKLKESIMRDLLVRGIGYMYLGMDDNDKELTQEWYQQGHIKLLIVTVSMCFALSVRPYLTVIMDTQHYNGESSVEYSLIDMLQMVGLTGRPLEDHECKCIVMCRTLKADLYDRLLTEPIAMESHLPHNLANFVNMEVAADCITELNNIYKPYLACSFLHKRISKNPNYYGILDRTVEHIEPYFNKLVNEVAADLHKNEFIIMRNDNSCFEHEPLSDISLNYYLQYRTLLNFNQSISENKDLRTLALIELLSIGSVEFLSIPVRFGELDFLRKLRNTFRIDGSINSPAFKAKLLILSQYDKEKIDIEGELYHDLQIIMDLAYRLLMSIVDIAWIKDAYPLAKTAIKLSQKLVQHSTAPTIAMTAFLQRREENIAELTVNIDRDDEPLKKDETYVSHSVYHTYFRTEGWCLLVSGHRKLDGVREEKFVCFKRVLKAPTRGLSQFKYEFELPEDSNSYLFDVYLMSDFYQGADQKIVQLELQS